MELRYDVRKTKCDVWLLELYNLLKRVREISRSPSPAADLRLDSMRQLLGVLWQCYYNCQYDLQSEVLTLDQVEDWRGRNRRAADIYQLIMDCIGDGVQRITAKQEPVIISSDRPPAKRRRISSESEMSSSSASSSSCPESDSSKEPVDASPAWTKASVWLLDCVLETRYDISTNDSATQNYVPLVQAVDRDLTLLQRTFEPEEILSAFVCQTILKRLPDDVKDQWQRQTRAGPSWHALKQFLVRIGAGDLREKLIKMESAGTPPTTDSEEDDHHHHDNENRQTSGRKRPWQMGCQVCGSRKHVIHKCIIFKRLSLEARWNIVEVKAHCHLCLSPYHRARDCKGRGRCKICKQDDHNILLCKDYRK